MACAVLKVVDLTPRIGAEIQVDVATLLDGSCAGEIRDALDRRGVLCFRGIALDDEQQLAFSRTLGEVMPQGNKGIFTVSINAKVNPSPEITKYQKGSVFWHFDTATDAVPTRASILGARVLSETGGDTEFANTYAAYEDLPEHERAYLGTLQGGPQHRGGAAAGKSLAKPAPSCSNGSRSPLPRTHSYELIVRGEESLVLGATASHVVRTAWISIRVAHCFAAYANGQRQPQYVYRHKWNIGDLVIWDNTGTLHRATPYPENSGRRMHRTTLVGEEPLA